MQSIRVSARRDLECINEMAHDAVFRPAEMQYDRDTLCLLLPFAYVAQQGHGVVTRGLLWQRSRIPLKRGLLLFHGATNVQMHDDAEIGLYMLERVECSEAETQVTVTAIEDMKIVMTVSTLEVELQLLDDEAGERIATYLFGLIEMTSSCDVSLYSRGAGQ
jgi:hypothetical protein